MSEENPLENPKGKGVEDLAAQLEAGLKEAHTKRVVEEGSSVKKWVEIGETDETKPQRLDGAAIDVGDEDEDIIPLQKIKRKINKSENDEGLIRQETEQEKELQQILEYVEKKFPKELNINSVKKSIPNLFSEKDKFVYWISKLETENENLRKENNQKQLKRNLDRLERLNWGLKQIESRKLTGEKRKNEDQRAA